MRPWRLGTRHRNTIALALLVWWSSPFPVLPRPDEVFSALRGLWFEQRLGRELATSFVMNLEALGLTLLISLGLSYLTVLPAFRPVAVAVSKGRFLGLIGLTFAFTLVVGGGRPLKVSLLVFGMTVFFVTSMAAEVAAIPRDAFDHARTLRMSEWRTVWEVVWASIHRVPSWLPCWWRPRETSRFTWVPASSRWPSRRPSRGAQGRSWRGLTRLFGRRSFRSDSRSW